MYIDQQPYRELYDRILGYEGDALHDDLLQPWIRAQDGERRWLDELRTRRGSPMPAMRDEELCRLYALSRIIQLLQLSFAPPAAEPAWKLATIERDDFARFMAALGLEAVERPDFHPFHHEIVTVDQLPDDRAPAELVETYWSAWTLGPLLISRAGCHVRAGRHHLLKEIAEQSTLYWAYARNHRPTDDPSKGWGGNSQWRTAFRRDYALDGVLHYNVDGREHPGGTDPELTDTERAELVRHRCFVTSTRRSDDRWPYGFRLTENA